jgi:hypothetical protein
MELTDKQTEEVAGFIVNDLAEYFQHMTQLNDKGELTPYELKKIVTSHVDNISEYTGDVNELYASIFEILMKNILEKKENLVINFDITKTTYPEENVRTSDFATGLVFDSYKHKPSETPLESLSVQWENENISISRKIEPEDREVHDAVMTLYDAGNKVMTTQTIYRTMTANPKAKLTEPMREKILNSILKLSGAIVNIKGKDEDMEKYPKVRGVVYRENIIYSRSVTAEHKGERVDAIEILEKPVLLRYAELEGRKGGRISRTPMTLLNTPVRKDMETIVIQGFLQRKIKMFSQGKMTPTILLEDVYDLIDFSNFASEKTIRNKKSKIMNVVTDILDYWKEHEFINDYLILSNGRTKRAIKITL